MDDFNFSYDAVLPSEILFNDNISSSAIRVYALIRSLARKCGYAYISNRKLAEYAKQSLTTVKDHLKDLCDEGFIEIEHVLQEGQLHDDRRIYISDNFKKCLRRPEIRPPLDGNPSTPGRKSGHILEDKLIKRVLGQNRQREQSSLTDAPKEASVDELRSPEEIVCSVPKENNNFNSEKEVLKKIEFISTKGEKITISESEFYVHDIQNRKNWSKSEIEAALKILADYKGCINNPFRFVEKVIENLRKEGKKLSCKTSQKSFPGIRGRAPTKEEIALLKQRLGTVC